MTCDIIMPARNQEHTLPRVIAALSRQKLTAGDRLRLILADDGSTDGTSAVARRACRSGRLDLKIIDTHRRGAAAARNRALEQAAADIVLLLGADIILRPAAVARHFALHRRETAMRAAGLGMVRWDPRLSPTPFMEWLIHGGPQNNFDALLGISTAPPAQYWYASHLSAKAGLLRGCTFNETFTGYGWEDLELGRRLQTAGCTLYVLHEAIGLHTHRYSAADIFRRQAAAGRQLPRYQQLHPAVRLLPVRSLRGRIKQHLLVQSGAHAALKLLLKHTGSRVTTPRLFSLAADTEFWQGVKQELRLK